MSPTTKRELKAWGRSAALLAVIVLTGVLIVMAGLSTV